MLIFVAFGAVFPSVDDQAWRRELPARERLALLSLSIRSNIHSASSVAELVSCAVGQLFVLCHFTWAGFLTTNSVMHIFDIYVCNKISVMRRPVTNSQLVQDVR